MRALELLVVINDGRLSLYDSVKLSKVSTSRSSNSQVSFKNLSRLETENRDFTLSLSPRGSSKKKLKLKNSWIDWKLIQNQFDTKAIE